MNRSSCAALAGFGIIPALPAAAWAHAMVQRYDLPVPLWYYLAGAGLVVALTFVVLVTFRKDGAPAPPRSRDISRTWLGRLLAGDMPGRIPAILSVVVFLFLIAAGLLGTQEDPLANILPAFVWVAWVGGSGLRVRSRGQRLAGGESLGRRTGAVAPGSFGGARSGRCRHGWAFGRPCSSTCASPGPNWCGRTTPPLRAWLPPS